MEKIIIKYTEPECSICLSLMDRGCTMQKEEAFCKCQHVFCPNCISLYVKNKDLHDIMCPLCRQPCLDPLLSKEFRGCISHWPRRLHGGTPEPNN